MLKVICFINFEITIIFIFVSDNYVFCDTFKCSYIYQKNKYSFTFALCLSGVVCVYDALTYALRN